MVDESQLRAGVRALVLAAAVTWLTAVPAAGQTPPAAPPASAQGQAQEFSTARNRQAIEHQAHPVTLIGRDIIDFASFRSPGDILTLFNVVPGVRTEVTSPTLGLTTFRIQGLPARYTRLLLDGVHLFSDRPGGYAPVRIPPVDLQRVEIFKGPAGAFYGSDSPAGSVNLISRVPGASPDRQLLFSQSSEHATDGYLWMSTPGSGSWSNTLLVSGHRQEERDLDDDGWPDIAGHQRGTFRQRVFWDNKQGKSVSGVAGVTFEKRRGGADFAREELETRTADGGLSGQMVRDNGTILAGSGALFVQSRRRDFGDIRERDRLQTATIEITLRKPGTKHSWLGGVASDWYAVRSADDIPTKYVSTRPGIFFHDDWNAASWLMLSGSARVDYHNLYDLLLSPRGSALIRGGQWLARVSAGQGYYTPRPMMDETEAAGLSMLTIDGPFDVETARSFSVELAHRTAGTLLSVTMFRNRIEDPVQIDRATYTLRQESDPITTRGVEVLGEFRRGPFALIGTYMFVKARERGGLELARTPEHSGGLIAAVASGPNRAGLEVSFTGRQRLDANPFRSVSEAFTTVALFGERRFGRFALFVNAENLTGVRQTDWDPIVRPSRGVDGRWTVDAWAPLRGRVVNGGLRVLF